MDSGVSVVRLVLMMLVGAWKMSGRWLMPSSATKLSPGIRGGEGGRPEKGTLLKPILALLNRGLIERVYIPVRLILNLILMTRQPVGIRGD